MELKTEKHQYNFQDEKTGKYGIYYSNAIDENINPYVIKYMRLSNLDCNIIYHEAKILQKLNIDYFVELVEQNDTVYLIMKYIEGQTLLKIFPKDMKSTLDIYLEILDHVEYIHKHGIIHCDLKPSNILISSTIHIIDYGTAKIKDENTISDYVTYTYGSLEQCKQEKIDETTDIYSLGIILFEMITETRCMKAKEKKEIIEIKQNNAYPKISDFILNIPCELDQVFYKCVDKNKENRYQSIKELKDDIIKIINRYYLN